MNCTLIHVFLSDFWQIPGYLTSLLIKCKAICWSYGAPSFWPSFIQKDSILPERTPAVALIEAFTFYSWAKLSLKCSWNRHFKGPHCYTNASILPVRGRNPVKCPGTEAVRMEEKLISQDYHHFSVHLSSRKTQ